MDDKKFLDEFVKNGIWDENNPLKLHLGCGSRNIKEFINIDLPISSTTIQDKSGADYYVDILKLVFPPSTVDEIRLHHVFEHFDRPTALAQLCFWHIWLKEDGVLTIETPNLSSSLWILLFPFYSYNNKQIVLRHLFGSHEADWAIHYDGWYKRKYQKVLISLGFGDLKFKYSKWRMTRNITVVARKTKSLSLDSLIENSIDILKDSLLDNSDSETRLLSIWINKLKKSLNK